MMRPVALLLLAAASNQQYTPSFPGGIVAWIVCNARKRQEYGGWLLFFYWQLYSGVIMTIVFFCINFQSYVPENFDDPAKYYWFLASVLPSFVIFALELAVATTLISVRTWDLLCLLRGLVVAQLVAGIVSSIIDIKFFPDNLPLELIFTLIPFGCWSAYFFVSKRVEHVFREHDWDEFVETLYPSTTTKLVI